MRKRYQIERETHRCRHNQEQARGRQPVVAFTIMTALAVIRASRRRLRALRPERRVTMGV